jgi:multidrug efflux system outer membrane protein
LQKALQEETILAYEKTVLTAFQEVENALIAYAKEQQRRTALLDAVTANRKAVDLSTRLYTEGLTDFLNVLIAQRSLFVSEDALVQSTRNLSADLVALYKALGGGWENQ